jgi:hypothetical protein
MITPAIEPVLYAGLATKCAQLGCRAVAIGGIADHVHVLSEFDPMVALARLIGEMKGASTHLVNHAIGPASFRWQRRYGAFTVSKRALPDVRAYILDQKARHRSGTTNAAVEPHRNPRRRVGQAAQTAFVTTSRAL